jgi:hypothetical protein
MWMNFTVRSTSSLALLCTVQIVCGCASGKCKIRMSANKAASSPTRLRMEWCIRVYISGRQAGRNQNSINEKVMSKKKISGTVEGAKKMQEKPLSYEQAAAQVKAIKEYKRKQSKTKK